MIGNWFKVNGRFLFIVCLVFTILLSAQIILANWQKPPNTDYTGATIHMYYDSYFYLANISYFSHNNWLLKLVQTADYQPYKLVSIIWLLLGKLVWLLGVSPVIVFVVAKFIFGYFFLAVWWWFCQEFISKINWRRPAFLFGLVPIGLDVFYVLAGKILVNKENGLAILDCIDLQPLWSIMFSPHYSWFLAMYLLSLIVMKKVFITRSNKYLWLAGLTSSILIVTHPYQIVPLFLAVGALYFSISIQEKNLLFKQWTKIGWWLVMIFPALLLVALNRFGNNNLQESYIANPMFLPPWAVVICGLGLALIFGCLGIYFLLKDKEIDKWQKYFWLITAICGLAICYWPSQFQKRMLISWRLLLGLMIGLGAYQLFNYLRRRYWGFFVLMIFSVICLCNFFLYYLWTVFNFPKAAFVDRRVLAGFEFINNNLDSKEIFFSNQPTSLVLSAFTGQTVYVAHGYNTNRVKQKRELAEHFFSSQASDEFRKQILRGQNIDYLYLGPEELKLVNFRNKDYLKLIYQDSASEIYESKVK